MNSPKNWHDAYESTTEKNTEPQAVLDAMWRASELAPSIANTIPTGWPALDQELPGQGWPCNAVTEILTPQTCVLEWRLLGPALKQAASSQRQVLLVGPPQPPHAPGLLLHGVQAPQIVWIQAETVAQRLWVTEQLIKSQAPAAIVSWLPQSQAHHIRRLQVHAQSCPCPVFLLRPESTQRESSAAPLRLHARACPDWTLDVQIFKRRGATHLQLLRLASIPGNLSAVLTPRMLKPSTVSVPRKSSYAVGRPHAPSAIHHLATER